MDSDNPFRAGDVVTHLPTSETWVLAVTKGPDVFPCGWPPTAARARDCVLKRAATDAEYRKMLEDWAGKDLRGDFRGAAAVVQLERLNHAYVGAGI